MSAAEFDLIDRIRSRAGARADVALGIGDDAALLQMPADRQLVVTADTLNVGVHFSECTAPADIGWKALAVNLSDLAAMAAEPAWCTLSLSLPVVDLALDRCLLDGFLVLAGHHNCRPGRRRYHARAAVDCGHGDGTGDGGAAALPAMVRGSATTSGSPARWATLRRGWHCSGRRMRAAACLRRTARTCYGA